ncbi:heavy-metal-associated domain-containing protein [Crystallibacter degradans]|uniref:heavy-metal-associated domain-containing protein n=1 Tax=Crystallibacter degradans TaxID=2726743 RepID=UPI001472A950|nr:cation transporter [Arthrobacter sp. SF27]NMR32202.1 heavy-metal-associated domain-containing protein [Arthrobacter sp. SF27]
MCGTSNRELPVARMSARCSCCSSERDTGTENEAKAESDKISAQFQVTGMTCGHCASSVSGELGKLEGVSNVAVALVPGGSSTVTVYGGGKPDREALRAAVAEAGYQLAESK